MPQGKGRGRPGRPCGMWPPALGSGRASGSHSKSSPSPLTLTTWVPGQGLVGRLLWATPCEPGGPRTGPENGHAGGGPGGQQEVKGGLGGRPCTRLWVSSGARGRRVGRAVPLRPRPEAGGWGLSGGPRRWGSGRLQPTRSVLSRVHGHSSLLPFCALKPFSLPSLRMLTPFLQSCPGPRPLLARWGQAVGTCPELAGCSCALRGWPEALQWVRSGCVEWLGTQLPWAVQASGQPPLPRLQGLS